MNWTIGFAILLIVGSVGLMIYHIQHLETIPARGLYIKLMVFMLGLSMLIAGIIPSGVISQATQAVFDVTAIGLLVAAVRAESVARRRRL